jgi:hypothetical protein
VTDLKETLMQVRQQKTERRKQLVEELKQNYRNQLRFGGVFLV